MKDNPLISIIVPVYKVEAYLERCVSSLVGQSYTNLEILLVDDGSPDKCPMMCDAWAEKDSRIRVIHKQNGGLSDARNAGLAAATGDLIAFVDSDDWIAPEMMERLLHAIQEDDSDIAACTVKMVWDDGTPEQILTVQTNRVLSREQAQAALLRETLLKQPVWYKLYRRPIVDGIPFAVGKQHEDVFWSYQAVGKAERVSLIDYPGYYYRQRAESIMGARYSLKRLDAVEACEERYAYLADKFPQLERPARMKILTSCLYHGQLALRYLDRTERKRAFRVLTAARKRYHFPHRDYANYKFSRRVWLDLARISLKLTCALRNLCGVGL